MILGGLVALGLTVGAVTTAPSVTIPSGSVISQTPAAGTTVAVNTAVALVVSSGSSLISVPNVATLTQSAASAAIATAGLTVGAISNAASAVVPAGSVISQTPAAGTAVAAGTSVALVVSTGTPTVSIASSSVMEGNTGCTPCTPMAFTVTLSAASSQTVSVSYSTLPGTALPGKDYNAATGTLTFAAGETVKTIVVQVIGDTTRENTETLTVRIATAVNALLGTTDGLGSILNDDQ